MLRASALALSLLLAAGAAHTADDRDLLAAHDAYRDGDKARLAQYARRIEGHLLAPYAEFWLMELRLNEAGADEVRSVLARHPDTVFADRLRAAWLKVLGKREDWDNFRAQWPQLVSKPDVELRCLALRARLAAGASEALTEGRALWRTGRDAPDACDPLFEAMRAGGLLDDDEVWQRVRLAFQAGNVAAARRAAAWLHQPPEARTLDAVARAPQQYLAQKKFNLKRRADRELVLFALERIARSDPLQAEYQWRRVEESFARADQAYFWGRLAYQGARQHDEHALEWFRRAGEAQLSAEQLAWKARAALRAAEWRELAATIDGMDAEQRGEPAWRYWKARALRQQGAFAEANALWAPLAAEFNFYGQLAREELGESVSAPPDSYRPSRDEVDEAARLPGLQRALALYRLDLRSEGVREWNFTVRGMDDRQLLAAATVALRNGWYDRAISTSDRTLALHDFSLRYPAPHREVMSPRARELNLDEAWVYGLIRQESRFVTEARSGAGARGLMQLMPATARWVAKQMGIRNFRLAAVNELQLNVDLGTYYLKHVMESLDNHPVLASAAYNAGPGRARRWRPDAAPLEGAAYAESIPFDETRDYVQKVMSNATYYASLFRHQADSLRARLGLVTPRGGGAETVAERR